MTITLQNTYYIVRHGKAKNNELGIESCKIETQKDFGLIPEGREKVSQEAQKYKNFDLIFSSPFRRTQETASFFAETPHCSVIVDDRLVDIDLGDLDLQAYEVSGACIKEHPSVDYVYQNGESFSHVLERLLDFLKNIDAKYQNKKILIVSHGVPCETLLDWAKGIPLRNWNGECIEKGKVFPLLI